MQCGIQWIDSQGKPTPDENTAVAWAQYHYCKHEWGTGRIVEVLRAVDVSYPICAAHLAQVTPDMRFENGGLWSFAPIVPAD